MSRLIDADELKGCAIIMPTASEDMSHVLACKGLIKHDDIPTVEAVPVVHGEWKRNGYAFVSCSECGNTIDRLRRTNFCSDCGADMRTSAE